jgi:hypothetical protein
MLILCRRPLMQMPLGRQHGFADESEQAGYKKSIPDS